MMKIHAAIFLEKREDGVAKEWNVRCAWLVERMRCVRFGEIGRWKGANYDVDGIRCPNHEFGRSKMEYSRLNVSPYSGAYSWLYCCLLLDRSSRISSIHRLFCFLLHYCCFLYPILSLLNNDCWAQFSPSFTHLILHPIPSHLTGPKPPTPIFTTILRPKH